MESQLVSVIINNYNYGTFLHEAIDSVLKQTYPNIEIVVVDDGSTDDSREIIASYEDQIIPVLKKNEGQISAVNEGFSASTGEIICFLDSDDVWSPNKVERVVAILQRYPKVAWVRHKLQLADANLHALGRTKIPAFSGSHLIFPDPNLYVEKVVNVSTSALTLRRVAAREIFPVPNQLFKQSADGYVATRHDADAVIVSLLGTVQGLTYGYSLDEALGYYRRHDSQPFSDTTYVGDIASVKRMLTEQIAVGMMISAVWARKMQTKRIGTHVHKHSLIMGTLEGHPLWHAQRLSSFAKGIAEVMKFLSKSPRLALRQTVALVFALVVPHLWVKRMLKAQGRQRK